jgi:heme exporter protein D
MPPFAYFGIESSGLNLVIDLLILFVVVLYLALIYWTYADAKRRIEDPMLVWCATGAALFPFVGALVYMVLRPPEYLEDVRERELETQAAEARVRESADRQCPHCDYPIERDFVRCPSCMRKLKERCSGCSRPLERGWAICPYCETEVPKPASARRARRRAAADGSGADAAIVDGKGRAAGELSPAEIGAATPLAATEAARKSRPGRAPRPARPPAPEA